MNSVIINNLYLVWFSHEEFPLFYSEYKSTSREFLISILSAFSLSVGSVYITPVHMYDAPFVIIGEFLMHTLFFLAIPPVLAYNIDYQARKLNKSADIKIILSFVRYSLSILALSAPFAMILAALKIQGSVGFVVMVLVLSIIAVLNTLKGASEVYKIDKNMMFRIVFNSFLFALIVPPLLCFYYILTILSVIL
ncbi:MAG: hypothetical protein SFU98_11505 [Leptospiraceae bacterium]|nr:hypothetical protein [Leptospiraceae bacterium]